MKEISMFYKEYKNNRMLFRKWKIKANDYILSQIPNLNKIKNCLIFYKEMAERIID